MSASGLKCAVVSPGLGHLFQRTPTAHKGALQSGPQAAMLRSRCADSEFGDVATADKRIHDENSTRNRRAYVEFDTGSIALQPQAILALI